MILNPHEQPFGKRLFLARFYADDRELLDSGVVRRAGMATQHGTQMHAGDNDRRVVEIIRSGAIGGVTEVVGWTGVDAGLGAAVRGCLITLVGAGVVGSPAALVPFPAGQGAGVRSSHIDGEPAAGFG